ncbi:hypothetical protein, partial [uncultured Brachyspira sp.]|uniref:hypothetical protein n=1 Tax=uncultured Brachyspira sp. TaxID=221953 RepID=UPI00261F3CA6
MSGTHKFFISLLLLAINFILLPLCVPSAMLADEVRLAKRADEVHYGVGRRRFNYIDNKLSMCFGSLFFNYLLLLPIKIMSFDTLPFSECQALTSFLFLYYC